MVEFLKERILWLSDRRSHTWFPLYWSPAGKRRETSVVHRLSAALFIHGTPILAVSPTHSLAVWISLEEKLTGVSPGKEVWRALAWLQKSG